MQLTRYPGASFDEIPAFDEPQRLELSVDGTPVHVFELHADAKEGRGYSRPEPTRARRGMAGPLPGESRPADVALTFLNRTPALLENLLEPFEKPTPGGPNGYYTTQKGAYLRSIEISGPYEATGAGRHAQPSADFRLPAGRALRPNEQTDVREDRFVLGAGPARVQAAGRRCRYPDGAGFVRRGPRRRAISSSASSGRWKACS